MSTLHPSPLGDQRPTREQLQNFANGTLDDRLPAAGTPLRLLIVGINPGLWTSAVNAPFAFPGNRFWPSLDRAGIVTPRVDASRGLSDEVEEQLARLGIGITNLVDRATARADELTVQELKDAPPRLCRRPRRHTQGTRFLPRPSRPTDTSNSYLIPTL